MANTYLSMTGTGDAKKWTFSGWFKKTSNGSELRLITSSDNSSYDDNIRFNSDDTITIRYRNAVVLKTNRKFRDNNAFYHIVVKVDTDQTTVNNRIILYVNGIDERVNGYSTDDLPGQGLTGYLNYNITYIGVTNPTANSNHFNGIMSHINFTDAYAYDASAFGETDATTGEWKIKTSPSVTYGTNGFFILKDGNSVTDQSPNTNNFTVGAGTLTKTEDNPSNNFATLMMPGIDSVNNYPWQNNLSFGNLKGSSTGYSLYVSTLGMTTGKYYWESIVTLSGSSNANSGIGIKDTKSYYYSTTGNKGNSETPATSYGSAISSGSIVGTAYDATNGTIWFSLNGVWQNSATIGEIAAGTTTNSAFSSIPSGTYVAAGTDATSTREFDYNFNFGNGYFGTTAVSSAGTNASNNGIFEYDVPTGFTALSTKGLNL